MKSYFALILSVSLVMNLLITGCIERSTGYNSSKRAHIITPEEIDFKVDLIRDSTNIESISLLINIKNKSLENIKISNPNNPGIYIFELYSKEGQLISPLYKARKILVNRLQFVEIAPQQSTSCIIRDLQMSYGEKLINKNYYFRIKYFGYCLYSRQKKYQEILLNSNNIFI
jgi:hypothetical protein